MNPLHRTSKADLRICFEEICLEKTRSIFVIAKKSCDRRQQGTLVAICFYSPPCPWDTHYQFSIKTLLSNDEIRKRERERERAREELGFCSCVSVS